MRRLTAMDAQFLYNEELAPAAHQHTIKVSMLGEAPDRPYRFEESKAMFGARLHRLPPFRWRAVPVPADLHHPVWVNDPDFDLDFHVRRMAVPAPGGMPELCELISDIASRPLDRNKPLWELYLIEGLGSGQLASVAKVHHSLADGVASAELLNLFYDPSPDAPPPEPDRWEPEEVPTRRQLLAGAVVDLVRLLGHGLPQIITATRRARQAETVAGVAVTEQPPKMFTAPKVPFARPLTPHRTFTVFSVPLDEVRAVKSAFGTTINDVVLATAAGGLRRWLERRQALPDGPLVGSVPVSTRPEGQEATWGNHLSKIYVSIRTDIADPVERLQASRAAANAAKADLAGTMGTRIENWIEYLPVAVLRAIGRSFIRKIRAGQSSENLVVSNVPGPRSKLWIEGAPMESFFSMGPLAEGVGLNITAWSYVDQMNVCLLACRDLIPDLWELTQDLDDAFDELKKLAAERAAEGPTEKEMVS